MKPWFAFFLSMCFLLFWGYNYAHAGTHHKKISYIPSRSIDKPQKAKLDDINVAILKHSSPSHDKEFFLNIEDEESDFAFTRKYVLLVKWVAVISCTFVLGYLFNYNYQRLPFCRHLSYNSSYKYIVQRALRV